MANEQVRIDLTANDKASQTIDKVADKTEGLEKLDPEVTIGADDRASDDLNKVSDAAKALDKLDPEVTIGADDRASDDIKGVREAAEALARADAEIVLRAKVDAAKANLAELQSELKQTGEKAETTARQLDKVDRGGGSGLRGNAIADLTGPLGEASSAASDFAGVFDGIGDISESVAERVGISAVGMSTAIGGIGVAIAAAAAIWTFYKQRQEEARKKQEELVKGQRDLNKAIAEGDRAAAAAKFDEMYGDALRAAEGFGVSVQETTRFITGQTDELPQLNAALADAERQLDETSAAQRAAKGEAANHVVELKDVKTELENARGAYDRANGSISEQDRRLRAVGSAFQTAKGDTDDFATSQERVEESTRRVNEQLDRMRGALDVERSMNDFKRNVIDAMNEVGESALDQSDDVIALKDSVISMGEQFKRNPVEIQTVLDAVDQGDLQSVAKEVENWYKAYPITLASKLDRPGTGGGTMNNPGGIGPRSVDGGTTVVNMTLPAGWRGDPVRTAHAQRRRTGAYFARN